MSSVRIQEISENHETSDKPEETEKPDLPIKQIPKTLDTNCEHEILWYLEFDGSVNNLGVGAGVWVHNLENNNAEGHAYRLNFRCTNNMAKYEVLLLGLKLVKKLGATRVLVLGDSDLIIQQIKGKFLTNDPRLREYRETTIEILNTFLETQLAKIPRKHNLQSHSLAMFASTCKLPFEPNHQFTAEIRHRPAIPDNVKKCQVFDSDNQINNFLTLEREFSSTNIDVDTVSEFDQTNQIETDILVENATQTLHPTKFTKKEIQDLKEIYIDEIIEGESKVINLKDNHFPKGLTHLEDLFNFNDIPKKPKMEPLKADIEDYNIGTEEKPKMVKLSKSLPPDQNLSMLN